MDCNAEWLAVLERQQQEIELLRQELTARDGGPLGRRGSDASTASSVASLAFSVLSMRDDALPMDNERYAAICDKMERMRAALVMRGAKLQKARARRSEANKEAESLRAAMEQLRSQVEAQRAQLAASQDAVDQAVDTAAQALVKNDLLVAELNNLRETDAVLCQDVRARTIDMKAAEATRDEIQEQLQLAQQETTRLTTDMRVLQNALQRVQQELIAMQKWDSEGKELQVQSQMQQQRMRELDRTVQQQMAQVQLQTRLIDQQNQQIQQLKEEQVVAERSSAIERAEDQRHAAHLLKNNIALQHELECEQTRRRKLNEQVSEASETSQLLGEELLQTKLVIRERDRLLQQRGEKYCELVNAYRGLGRHAQSLESSERELVSVLIPSKKRLALLQDTLTRFCYELEGVSKQMVTSRNREVSLGRALREYGKRNRKLQASVIAARQQLHNVVSAFRSSERRKEQAISASWNLKRDLVLERCQRTDLVQQCKELESCLDSCQSSASETQARAEGLEKDNGVLQHAVKQLVAYARELMSSQESLQRELTKLEITGRRQPAVYG
ncbi:hypothetical protein KRP22_008387 [Phytophthora ramorum]|uniref:uncharacterized protein n=2 Tax=Phytophthora ramorum TaxID=164328 RepID=UPI0030A62E8A|nr:hypothetical protein KRP23_14794 [Phytophthora ramorum]KAH7505627.1 hypothetical protein KRP22_3600 [Phytophthora ramorum]